jgi:hypothetical protein
MCASDTVMVEVSVFHQTNVSCTEIYVVPTVPINRPALNILSLKNLYLLCHDPLSCTT